MLHAVANLTIQVKELKQRRVAEPSRDHGGSTPTADTTNRNQHQTQARSQKPALPRLPRPAELDEAAMVVVEGGANRGVRHGDWSFAEPHGFRTQRSRTGAVKEEQPVPAGPLPQCQRSAKGCGRLCRSELTLSEKHPVLLPRKNHISELFIRHHHEKVYHQGRQITQEAVRQAGNWVIGSPAAVSKVISSCVPCRKVRGPRTAQHMADLPADRLEKAIEASTLSGRRQRSIKVHHRAEMRMGIQPSLRVHFGACGNAKSAPSGESWRE